MADRYSQTVALLKVALPLAALALLSTLFLLSRAVDTELSIPFAEKEIQDRLREQVVTAPLYRGTTAEGDEIAFTAETLTTPPGSTGLNRADRLDATLTLAGGGVVHVTSDQGLIDIAGNLADLQGNVVVTTDSGYRVTSDQMLARLSGLDLRSPGEVRSTGPLGTLTAGAMVLENRGPKGQAHLVFTKGVKLVYSPSK